MVDPTCLNLTEEEISRRLDTAIRRPSTLPGGDIPLFLNSSGSVTPRPAAVLIPLLCINHEWNVLFTRRTNNLAEHQGQVAFPGGRAEPDDPDLQATALREAEEEIGLNPNDVRILGRLHEFRTITNYSVTPIVGVIPWPYLFRIETQEVSRVFTIPLHWLADSGNYEERPRILPSTGISANIIYYHTYDNEILWGASARFTLAFLYAIKNHSE
jgi:8-oxo-dGTP pyrophosphatase MutT (NUDIX family)